MKKIFWIATFIAVVMLLMPLSVLNDGQKVIAAAKKETKIEKTSLKADTFRIYDPETEKITEMKATDYIFGVVAAEIPALYEEEALKAQAVAAYTYACYNRNLNKDKDYDLSTDHNVSQSFIPKENLKEKWGSKTEEYTKKIMQAVKSVENYKITYNGEIILAVYHAISSGKTEDCINVWGKDYPYLKSVKSEWDKASQGYKTEITFTVDEIKEKLKGYINETAQPKDYFNDIKTTEAGTVTQLKLCENSLKGSDVRKALDLRSSNFTVTFNDDKFIFTVLGYGHGVGMSQNGANAMAKEGKSFKEILKHYYKDCKIEK